MPQSILIVEDDPSLRRSVQRYLVRSGYDVKQASTCGEAVETLSASGPIDLVLADVMLPDGTGFDVAQSAAERSRRLPVVIMTADDSIEHAIRAVKHHASDFLLKPFSFDALDRALADAMTNVGSIEAQDPSRIAEWRRRYAPKMLGNDPTLMRVFSIIERVSDTDCSTLVTGESGTGKELVARALHDASGRASGPFVTVNCAAIPENLIESELFGHVKGAFTGAAGARVGSFRGADGGTLFLDEIGELPISLQAKLLRVLQEKEVTPVGDHRPIKVDVRVITATNRDLEEMAETGTFREDLLYRLNVIPIELPPLRDRSSDVPELVRAFVERANQRRNRSIAGVDEDVMEALVAYDWPGNVRQLENIVERMVILRSEGMLVMDDLPPAIRRARERMQKRSSAPPVLPEDGLDLRDAIESFENALILQALERTGWNKKQAAELLRMNRTTLVEKLKKKRLEAAD